ncbi:MAG: flagellar hook-basal body complex protein FliE [Deltaproteobacteria bacterium]|jgi:flagellar hook-basal body complex protein FliE|nr:flagellar hook-basal body complex protein FliE [Deltaproteobacteria bacterium]
MATAPITSFSPEIKGGIVAPIQESPQGPSGGFADMLKTKIMEVDRLQHAADDAMSEGAVNGATNIHETMIQLEEADLGMRMMLKVRDKALSAYQEIMRMQF